MSTDSRPFVDRERRALADLMAKLGPDAPTCCAGWTTAHLAAHLVVRDRRPDAMAGYAVEATGHGGPLVAWAHRRRGPPPDDDAVREVVDRVRSGPPLWLPMAWPPVAQAINTTEFAIHHEDVRRASRTGRRGRCRGRTRTRSGRPLALYARRGAGRRGWCCGAPTSPARSGASARPAAPSRASRWNCCSGPPAAGTSPA